MEERNVGGTLLARYTYGASRQPSIGSNVEIFVPGAPDKTYTLLMDHRGTAHKLLDESQSTVGTRYYDAFGRLLGQSGSWPVDMAYQANWLTINIGNRSYGLSKYRIYDPEAGRFLSRDLQEFLPGALVPNLYIYAESSPINLMDSAGLEIETDCPIDAYLAEIGVIEYKKEEKDGKLRYTGAAVATGGTLASEIVAKMILSGRKFVIKGGEGKAAADVATELSNLKLHVAVRERITQVARAFTGKGLKKGEACRAARILICNTGVIKGDPEGSTKTGHPETDFIANLVEDKQVKDEKDWIPGDAGYIINNNPGPHATNYEGENVIYLAGEEWYGWPGGIKPIEGDTGWKKHLRGKAWWGKNQTEEKDAKEGTVDTVRFYPKTGLDIKE